MVTIQPFLPTTTGKTDFSFSFSGADVEFMLGLALIERVRRDEDDLRYKMALGRMVNYGVPLAKLEATFGHDHRTLRKWAEALGVADPDEMARAFGGRGSPVKVTEAVARYARMRWAELKGVFRDFRKRVAAEVKRLFDLDISGERLRQLCAVLEPVPETPPVPEDVLPVERSFEAAVSSPFLPVLAPDLLSQKEVDVPMEARGTSCAMAPEPSLEKVGSRNCSPKWEKSPTFGTIPLGQGTVGAEPTLVHHAGQLLFAPFLAMALPESTLLRRACLRWAGQLLQGAANIEQAKGLVGNDLARFTGVPPLCRKKQREQLWELACELPGAPLELYAANAKIARLGPLDGDVFYYDPHVKEYTGSAPIPKGWCGRIHAIAKIIALDCLHTHFGDPCLVLHFDNYFDLRERAIIIANALRSLFTDAKRAITLVVDRGIYGLEAFDRLLALSIYLVTWEKGYDRQGWREGAPTAFFSFTRFRNNRRDLRGYHIELQSAPWGRDPRVHRIIIRATNPEKNLFEASVLCSDPLMSDAYAVYLILNRWLEENDFKYLDHHFGFMQITTYAMIPYANLQDPPPDRPADSQEFRDLCRRLKEIRADLSKALVRRETLHDALKKVAAATENAQAKQARVQRELDRQRGDPTIPLEDLELRQICHLNELTAQTLDAKKIAAKQQRSTPALQARLIEAETQVATLKTERDNLDAKLDVVIRDDSRLRLFITAGLVRPDTRPKAIMDAIRIIARNAFCRLLEQFRLRYDNRRDDHAILRQLTRSPGILQLKNGKLTIGLWHCATLPPATRENICEFLDDLTLTINQTFPSLPAPVEITLLPTAPKL
jgi:hypothetical protein